MNETRKAMRRRWVEDATGVFPWRQILRGRAIDIGCGPDLLPVPPDCQPFDQEHGDANKLSTYFPAASFDLVHSSNSLEHMIDPFACLRDWLKLLKHGGVAVLTIPDLNLYEGGVWPSRFNPDHKSTWSMSRTSSKAPIHVHIPTFASELQREGFVTLRAVLVDTNYDYLKGASVDQTWEETAGIETFNEWILKRIK